MLQKNSIKDLELLDHLVLDRNLLDHLGRLECLGLRVHRDAGRRRRNRYSHRSIQRGARDHRVLDRSSREKCSWMVNGED